MNILTIAPTKSSPGIFFDPHGAVLRISGESYPENCGLFYQPVFAWLHNFLQAPATRQVTLDMELVYFNSSSSKTFMDLFDLLDEAAGAGKQITVNWRYHKENETALECGEEFREDVRHMRFNLVELD
ncbi:DUF1987 domain-containing protein [Oleidesulfovibrio alaskensis]|jgi:hypothetical protein|uniref:DUF1987 domain-containing protein n=1 Tax=Oleidesulfovibrio alaskensis TaxID=58180 RepID=UPI001A49C0A4|nr:DUF1987 domain-containing protein [Oleidesulfovibrio alaskensis]MBL3581949.1 DUF1987 domain-containing protein [Oleidesulfovibrio alaskensis]